MSFVKFARQQRLQAYLQRSSPSSDNNAIGSLLKKGMAFMAFTLSIPLMSVMVARYDERERKRHSYQQWRAKYDETSDDVAKETRLEVELERLRQQRQVSDEHELRRGRRRVYQEAPVARERSHSSETTASGPQ
ncbi:MAG: hypothetical protein MHM6MM_000926 [Cercozoa sp. M6MM]